MEVMFNKISRKTREEEMAFVYGACMANQMDMAEPITVQFKNTYVKAMQIVAI
jgi:hypothetical protein